MRREICDAYDRGMNDISIFMVTRVAIGFRTGYHYSVCKEQKCILQEYITENSLQKYK